MLQPWWKLSELTLADLEAQAENAEYVKNAQTDNMRIMHKMTKWQDSVGQVWELDLTLRHKVNSRQQWSTWPWLIFLFTDLKKGVQVTKIPCIMTYKHGVKIQILSSQTQESTTNVLPHI